MILAFHGESTLKAAVMDRLREHRRMDEIVQGTYFNDGRGCHLGCITHVNQGTHLAAERLFGIEQRVGNWLEAVFEGLPNAECAKWVIDSTDAIPVGADLSRCHHHFGAWLLSSEAGVLTITDGNREAIEQVRLLHVRAASGQTVINCEWSAARSAAELAARSAAESAAELAARSAAESSARSAAESSARSAARSAAELAARSAAESAAWSAAWPAAWQKIAVKSIEIFRDAPVASDQPAIESCVRSELCAKRLWCEDGELVTV